ncbi:hypothetical protein J1N35_037104 [Gossypium stocksii]|uniref:Uncharacterized protein n=1 Tax=Gossypium stocksii TaxID=47602 RepID=A0A9D3UJY1_9ROSI|nr:hypothetical protein J1N35_037104 [Gossypium stocksii]
MALIGDSHALVPLELSREAFIVFKKLKLEWEKLCKEMQATVQRKKIVGRRANSVVQGARSQLNIGDQNIQRLTTLSPSNRSFRGSSSDESDRGHPPGQLNFEYLEHDQPFSREPLVDKIPLRTFGLVFYKFKVSFWNPDEVHKSQKGNSLLRAADNWLWLLQVNHPGFRFFISYNTYRS